jgi:hypothetical protein
MTEKRTVTFADLLQQRTWTDYDKFVCEMPQTLYREVEEHVREERKLIEELRGHPQFKRLSIRDVNDCLGKAGELLMSGCVVGVDGTVSRYRLMSGLRCQIGVVAVNYVGEQIKHSFFISEANLRDRPEDALERVAARTDDDLPEMAIRGLMLYREREAGLDPKFEGKYVMLHGPLLPFELMSGLGRLRALETTLELLRRLGREKRFFSIISSTAYQDYLTFGRAIERGQYLTASSYTLGHHLANSSGFLAYREKWRDEERRTVEEFLRDYAETILIGVLRVGERPYVFHAPREIFDLAAAILARDAMLQPQKGFPLLLDYADTLCSQYFPGGDFRRIMDWELARHGAYLSEAPERELRMK